MAVGKSVVRAAKNTMGGYSDTETKVRDATSNANWGPTGAQMSEIAELTYHETDFHQIIEVLNKRLNDKGKSWRHVFKSLTLLHYLLQSGSDPVAEYFRANLYIIKTLKEFQHVDEYGKDQGMNVRLKAKDVTDLLTDERRRNNARRSRKEMNDRMDGYARPRSSTDPGHRSDEAARPRARSEPPRRSGDAERLAEAMKLSKEEYDRQQSELAKQSGDALFDEQGHNLLIDADSVPQQPAAAPAVTYDSLYAEQQRLQQEEWARQQQAIDYQRQANEQAQYSMMMMQQQEFARHQQMAQEEYIRQQQTYEQQLYQQNQFMQQQMQMQPLSAQPTSVGANNPFAANTGVNNPFSASTSTSAPTLIADSYADMFSAPSRNGYESYGTATQTPTPVSTPPRVSRTPRDDGKHAELARMLAGGREDGIDTFGNVGNLRIPMGAQFAQRTGVY